MSNQSLVKKAPRKQCPDVDIFISTRWHSQLAAWVPEAKLVMEKSLEDKLAQKVMAFTQHKSNSENEAVLKGVGAAINVLRFPCVVHVHCRYAGGFMTAWRGEIPNKKGKLITPRRRARAKEEIQVALLRGEHTLVVQNPLPPKKDRDFGWMLVKGLGEPSRNHNDLAWFSANSERPEILI